MNIDLKTQEQVTELKPVNTKGLSVGLDIGTCFLVCARLKENKIIFKTQRDAFFDIENTIMSKGMLNKLKANYIESEDKKNLFILGEEALQLANFFNKEARRPLAKGVISTREKESLAMIKVLLHSLVGDPIENGEKLYYSSPASPIDAEYNNVYHENVLKSFLNSFGYSAQSINEAFAIVWSELDDEDFTGMSLSFGAGMVNCALSFIGISEKSHQFSIARGGDWIDENSATATGQKASRMTIVKELGIDLLNPKNREENAIKIYYENLIQYTCNAIEKKLSQAENLPNFPKPITVIVSGGTSLAQNFEVLFEQELKTKTLPFKIKGIRKAKDQLNAVAKGCLLNALNFYS